MSWPKLSLITTFNVLVPALGKYNFFFGFLWSDLIVDLLI